MVKITIAVTTLIFSIGCVSNQSNREKSVVDSQNIATYDSIFFGSDRSLDIYKNMFPVNDSAHFSNGLILKTKGQGLSVWIDRLFYFSMHQNKFVAVSSTLNYGVALLYYNGDSLMVEKVATNKPAIEECKTNTFKVIRITDSVYNSGNLIKSILFYKFTNNGELIDKKEYFPSKKENENFDFSIKTACYKDSIIILKNGSVVYTYH